MTADTVYIGSFDWHLYAVDVETGEKRWSFYTGESIESSPTVVNDTVYFGISGEGYVYAVDATTGEEVWNLETDAWIRSSPTVAEGIVFIGSG